MDDELEELHELGELSKRKRKLVANSNFQELSKVCNRLGEILSHSGRYKEALAEHQAEEAACVAANDVLGVAIANRKIGECYAELAEYDEALINQTKHLELACEIHSEVEEQRAWATIGRTHLYLAETLKNGPKHKSPNDPAFVDALNRAEEAFHKSLKICSRLSPSQVGTLELDQMKGRLYHNLGMVMEHRNVIQSCLRFIQKALTLHRKHNQWEDLQRCHNYLSLVYQKNEDFKQCLSQAELALQAAVKLSNVKLQCEMLCLLGQVHLQKEDYDSAKEALRKAKKLVSTISSEKEEVDKLLRIGKRLQRLRTSVSEFESDDAPNNRNLMRAYDKMGDLCIKARIFKTAIKYYTLSLHYAELECLPKKDLAAFYVSLAQTYKDIGDYTSAADNLLLELNCYERDPKEKCCTLLNLADCREHLGAEYHALEPLYVDALCLARQSGARTLEKRCLVSLSCVQDCFGETEKKSKTQKMLKRFLCENKDVHSSSSEDDEDNESVISHSLELSSESSDEGESDAEVSVDIREVKCPRTNRRYQVRRNEKGETPLHRACIAGSLKKVQELIAQGHPVNERDYGGWLPLHEAANNNFPEIVKLLLENGAWVNDRGGSHCDGITPLHDAAANGNMEVIRVLLQHRASVLAKNDDGLTALDSLIAWKHRAENETSPELLAECDEMAEELQRRIGPDLHSDIEGACLNRPNAAVLELKSSRRNPNVTMEGNLHVLPVILPDISCEESSPALVEDGEILPDCDDWLIDDLGPAKQQRHENNKRRRGDIRSWIEGATHSRRRSNKSVYGSNSSHQEMLHVRNDSDGAHQARKRRRRHDSDVVHSFEETRVSSPENVSEQLEATTVPTTGTSSVLSATFAGLRIKVNIMGTLLLIPVPPGETVSWLAKEAAQRYFARTGLRPSLSLSNSEGALLSPDDAVSLVISSGEEVLGTLQSWDLPPLPERYVDSCKSLNAVPFGNIRQFLSIAETSMSAALANLRLTPTTFQPIFRALQCQATLRELNLSGNRLGNKGLHGLGEAMKRLPGLRVLDISSNDITDTSIGQLVQPLLGHKEKIMLENLNLDFNPLLENGCTNLMLMFKCLSNLTTLSIRSVCDESTVTLASPHLSKALTVINKIQQLNLSCNCLPVEQLEKVLTSLPSSCLVHLNLSAVASHASYAIQMCTKLSEILQSPSCILRKLYLSYSSLDDKSIAALLPGLAERSLEHLDISGNPALNATSADAISKLLPLTRVNTKSCMQLSESGLALSKSAKQDESDFSSYSARLNLGEVDDDAQIWTNTEDNTFIESYVF